MSAAVLFARDPGAANHVSAMAEVLLGRMHNDVLRKGLERAVPAMPSEYVLWGEGPALAVFAAAGLSAVECRPNDIEQGVILLKQAAAALLVSGTGDIDDTATRLLWQAARQLGVPSLALLDSPLNLDVRFDLARGLRPDLVVSPDQATKEGLLRLGFAAHEIMMVDNLHHARLATLTLPSRQLGRQRWRVAPETRVVLFVSENAAEARQLGRRFDLDEFALLAQLIRDVADRRPVGPMTCKEGEMVIVVRPHPRDQAGKYDRYVRDTGPRVIVSAEGTPAEAIAAADLVVGMSSALLDDAGMLGRPVHRLVPLQHP